MRLFKCAIVVFVVISSCYGHAIEPNTSCGDWAAYKDEKCVKLVDDTLRTFDDAKRECFKLDKDSSLPSIKSKEEQDFIQDYLFKTLQKVENVWLGAQVNETTHKAQWLDSTGLSFTNWQTGSPRYKAHYNCVQMQSDESVVGKWADEPCVKKNLVLCQKMQTWSLPRLQKAMLEARKGLLDSVSNSDREIAQLKQTILPVGFVYVQLSKEKAPHDIWPWMNWTDVSATYGNFGNVVVQIWKRTA